MGCDQKEYDRIDALQYEKSQKQYIDEMTCGDLFSSYLVIFQATL